MFNPLLINSKTLHKLQLLFSSSNIPNTLLYGPSGSGKKTIIRYILSLIFGKENSTTRLFNNEIKNNGNTYEYFWRISNVHYEIDASDFLGNDRIILMSILNELTDTSPSPFGYKIILIQHSNNLQLETWMALRKFIETNLHKIRFIFLAETLSGIPPFIKSRLNFIHHNGIDFSKLNPPNFDTLFPKWGHNLYLWIEYLNHSNKYNLNPPTQLIINDIINFINFGKINDWNDLRKNLIKFISMGINLTPIIHQVISSFFSSFDDTSKIHSFYSKIGPILSKTSELDKEIMYIECIILELKTL